MSEQSFIAAFGRPPSVAADAPGRVNLMGEHTDYNGGSVLPTAIPQRVRVWLRTAAGGTVRAASAELGGGIAEYSLGNEAPGLGWLDYLQGVTAVLGRDGHTLSGFDIWIESNVPIGSGLSSSAALDVAVLRGLRALFELPQSDVELARLGQRVETEFVGANVGIMDPMAASLADEHTALLIDTAVLSYQRIALPQSLELVIIDSGIRHSHATGGYNERRLECERAAALLGVRFVCELEPHDLPRVASLPEPLDRRVRHVVTENARVLATAQALRTDDEAALRTLFAESHASQRDDFAVSLPTLDRLVESASRAPDIVAARLTGGGFGGSIVLLARRGRGREAAHRVIEAAADNKARIVLPE